MPYKLQSNTPNRQWHFHKHLCAMRTRGRMARGRRAGGELEVDDDCGSGAAGEEEVGNTDEVGREELFRQGALCICGRPPCALTSRGDKDLPTGIDGRRRSKPSRRGRGGAQIWIWLGAADRASSAGVGSGRAGLFRVGNLDRARSETKPRPDRAVHERIYSIAITGWSSSAIQQKCCSLSDGE